MAKSGKAKRQIEVVYEYLAGRKDGATDMEVSEGTGLPIRQVTARRRELVLQGKVRSSAGRRQGAKGYKNIVWVLGSEPTVQKPRRIAHEEYARLVHASTTLLEVLDKAKTMMFKDADDFGRYIASRATIRRVVTNG